MRVNYGALGVEWPWVTHEAWQALVVSQSNTLNVPQRELEPQTELRVVRGLPACLLAGLCTSGAAAGMDKGGNWDGGTLVRIRVEAMGRGVPQAHALVSALPALSQSPAPPRQRRLGRGGCANMEPSRYSRKDSRGATLGYLTHGWYDSTSGKGVGVGFLSVAALQGLDSASTVGHVLGSKRGGTGGGSERSGATRAAMLCVQVQVFNPTSALAIECRVVLCA